MTRTMTQPQSSSAPNTIDWTFTLASLWFVAGLYLDGWAHTHVAELETFFTPWHAVLYSGFFATFLCAAYAFWQSRTRPELKAYRLAFFAGLVFMAGGVLDLFWHTLLGIEANIAALLSPPHLLLATSGFLIVTSPLRAAWNRSKPNVTAMISLAITYALLTFFTMYTVPLLQGTGVDGMWQSKSNGVMGVLLSSVVMSGVMLFFMRRWTLPGGALLLVLLPAQLGLVVLDRITPDVIQLYYLTVIASLLVLEILRSILQPSVKRIAAFRSMAFLIPAVFSLSYFLAVQLTGRMGWEIHLWLGAIFGSGVMGLLLSYLVLPPEVTPEAA
ncbi:hypothetical protein [Deinococcus cellulosilyticus]|uniref:Uncharacterized protein n=1 Tax=Deinococcus cellulosilyticus (strain DSM 18568 / NBRC 106333 / KACC 11606 / 5516J-15) TaxID=1223518 RepID=A0A511N2F1_DEIC1|nr:hypothetical protein [Deinococcus cellulosilyticus]GEM47022.1 hypothetical protein DC3_26570 [Deinococcus cellulosilyticus NBRC 106333 = KACC 11606]